MNSYQLYPTLSTHYPVALMPSDGSDVHENLWHHAIAASQHPVTAPLQEPAKHDHGPIPPHDNENEHTTEEQQHDHNNNNNYNNKGSSHGNSSARRNDITPDVLRSVFHMPINDAAKALGIGVTVLKKYCRKFGVKRWPYRKLKSMDKLIASVEHMTGEDGSGMAHEAVEELRKQRSLMEQVPDFDMDMRTKKLRQANFKFEYKQRQCTSQR